MSIKPGGKGDISLVHGDKGAGYAMVKMDARAMAIIREGLKNSIQKYESLEQPSEHDVEKLNLIKDLLNKIGYCRDACIKE